MKKLIIKFLVVAFTISASQEVCASSLVDSIKSALVNPKPADLIFLAPGAFVLGMVSSLTPCIYPMIPVTANIFVSSGKSSFLSILAGALAYFLGVTTVYSGAGFAAARTGTFFGRWFSSPWFLILAMLFFLIMSLYSLGLLKLSFLESGSAMGGSYFSSGKSMGWWKKYLLGALVGLTASPCITPALAMLLSFAAKTNTPFLGFLLLFFYAFGFCFLLLLSSIVFSRAILFRPGAWMNHFKTFLALMVAFYGFWFLEPIAGMSAVYFLCLAYAVAVLFTQLNSA